jgi:hypothetical protein
LLSNEAVRAAVEAGPGATAIPASVAVPSIEAGLLHRVAFRLPEREFHVLRHRERYQPALLATVARSPAERGQLLEPGASNKLSALSGARTASARRTLTRCVARRIAPFR